MSDGRLLSKVSLFYVGFVFIAVLAFVKAAMSSEVEEMLSGKPYFTLAFDVSGAGYFITVNGMDAFSNPDGSPLSAEVPVNHLMKSGENTVSIHILYDEDDPDGEKPKAEVKLMLSSPDQSRSKGTALSKIIYGKGGEVLEPRTAQRLSSSENLEPSDQGDIEISEAKASDRKDVPGKTISQSVYIESSLPLWAVFRSDKFFDEDPNYVSDEDYYKVSDVVDKDLFGIYQNIQRLLKSNNLKAVMPYFEERNRELDAAFYREEGETSAHLYESLLETINDDDYELVDIDMDDVGSFFYENGRLVSLTYGGGGSALVFDLKGGGHRAYSLIFRKENGKYIITR